MAMNRQQLARAIDVGRSSTLNCFETTKDIAGIAAGIDDDDPIGPLFGNRYLNESIVFKVVDSVVVRGKKQHGVETLIYFPFLGSRRYITLLLVLLRMVLTFIFT